MKASQSIRIRPVQQGDAAQLVALFEALDSETSMMLWEPGERGLTLEVQQHRVREYLDSTTQAMLVAESVSETSSALEIVGSAVAIGGKARRNAHVLSVAMGLKRKVWGQGIGQKLLHGLIAWAEAHQFARLELTVMAHNERAIALYQRCGFEIEGRNVRSLRIAGNWVDELTMAKLL